MPTETRLFVKSAVLYLVLALAATVAMSWGLLGPAWRATILHMITVGWLSQLIFGVAFWLFPRASAQQPRGELLYIRICLVALNIGLPLRVATEPLSQGYLRGLLLGSAAVLQLTAALAFAANVWPRLRVRS